jgi:hypothetical protein
MLFVKGQSGPVAEKNEATEFDLEIEDFPATSFEPAVSSP